MREPHAKSLQPRRGPIHVSPALSRTLPGVFAPRGLPGLFTQMRGCGFSSPAVTALRRGFEGGFGPGAFLSHRLFPQAKHNQASRNPNSQRPATLQSLHRQVDHVVHSRVSLLHVETMGEADAEVLHEQARKFSPMGG